MIKEFKVGMWLLYEHELFMVKNTTPYLELTDGIISTCGGSIPGRCFPLTLENKVIADTIHWYYDDLHRQTKGLNNFNWPRVADYFDIKFCDACENSTKENIQKVYNDVKNFCRLALSEIQKSKDVVICGIML